LKIRVRRAKIAEHHGHAHRAGGLGHDAIVARLFDAIGGAAVSVDVVPVVAPFVENDAISALRNAGALGTVGLCLAVRGAAVERREVAVFTALGAFLDVVTTSRRRADARASLLGTSWRRKREKLRRDPVARGRPH